MNVQIQECYRCSNCGQIYRSRLRAEQCCQPKECIKCGKELPGNWYCDTCTECLDKKRYEKAKKLSIHEWEEQYPISMVCLGEDQYFYDVDEALEYMAANYDDEDFMAVTYVYGALPDRAELNCDNIIDQFEEEYDIEDFYVDDEGVKELREFLIEWNRKYGQTYYYRNDNIIIMIPDELKKEYLKN